MRIISGRFKGRRFAPPSNITARPTTDFAKESLFNLITNMIDTSGITALDLFAGTGSISYELASRYATHITSVEMSDRHIAYIRKMCSTLGIDNIRTVKQDVFRFLANTGSKYDLIFADPPYQLPNINEIPDAVINNGHLNTGGILIVEHGKSTDFTRHPAFFEHRSYGNVHFSFFK
ncbi:MAG: RsmD family RNA methyltransferase [Candidatus Aphodosoma sp.]